MMLRLTCLCLLVVAGSAGASTVSVVATGDADLQAVVAKQAEAWLRGHGHTLGASLSSEATSTLLNCMVMDDQGCARGIVDTHAAGDAVLFAQAIRSRANNATVLNVYWFPKGKEPIGMRRACEECSVDLMRSTLDEIFGVVLGASKLARGRLALHSTPEGMTVLLDNETIGVTPLEREVPAGQHTIVLMHRGQRVGERTLKVQADVTAEINIPVTVPSDSDDGEDGGKSPIVGGLVLGIGAAALVAGVVLYVTSEEDDGSKLFYRDTKPLGIGFAAGGAVVAGLGVWLWVRASGSKESAPVVTIGPEQGVIGWSRAF
jgi:PEGA domain